MQITRRDLLKGAATAAAAGLPLLPDVALAHGNQAGGEGGVEGGEPSERIRRWVMIIDQRACDGCVGLGVPPQCTQFCNWSRFVPEGQQWVEVYESSAGHLEDGGSHYLPAPCMQCQNAPCVNVCPVGASFHTPEGIVLIDQERCIGCRLCMAACPYDRRFFNWGDPVQPPQVKAASYDVRSQIPAVEGTVMKCDFCTDKIAAGGLPACIEGCPRGAVYIGDLEEGIATNGKVMADIQMLFSADGVHRFKDELGTEPRVYYIPGHGENAAGMEADGEVFAGHADMSNGEAEGTTRRFMKDQLEWPWRKIAEELERVGLDPVAMTSEAADG